MIINEDRMKAHMKEHARIHNMISTAQSEGFEEQVPDGLSNETYHALADAYVYACHTISREIATKDCSPETSLVIFSELAYLACEKYFKTKLALAQK